MSNKCPAWYLLLSFYNQHNQHHSFPFITFYNRVCTRPSTITSWFCCRNTEGFLLMRDFTQVNLKVSQEAVANTRFVLCWMVGDLSLSLQEHAWKVKMFETTREIQKPYTVLQHVKTRTALLTLLNPFGLSELWKLFQCSAPLNVPKYIGLLWDTWQPKLSTQHVTIEFQHKMSPNKICKNMFHLLILEEEIFPLLLTSTCLVSGNLFPSWRN